MSKQNLALIIVLIIAGLSTLSVVGLFIFNSINKGDSLEEFPMNDSSFPAEENDNTSSGCDEQNQNVVFDAYMEDLSNEWQQWAPGENLEAETIGLYFMPALLDYGDKINKVYYDEFLGEVPQGSVLLQKSLSIEEVKNMVEQANQQYNVVASAIPRSDHLYKDGILSVVLDLETVMATNPFHNILSMNYDFKNGKEILLYDILNNQWQDAIRQRIWDEVKNMENLPPVFSVDRFPCLDSALGHGDSFLISNDGITIFIPGDRLDPYFCWENRGFTFNFEELKNLLKNDSDIVQRITGDYVSDNKNISLRNLKIQSALNQVRTQAEIIYVENNTYADLCDSINTINENSNTSGDELKSLEDEIYSNQDIDDISCYANPLYYCISVAHADDNTKFFCVDSSGNRNDDSSFACTKANDKCK